MVKSESAVSITAVYPSSSTVLVTVIIVVKYKACLSVGQLIIGVQARLFSQQITGVLVQLFSQLDCRCSTVIIGTINIVIVGIAALSVYQWYMAVRYQRRVSSVGRSARSLVIRWVHNSRHNSTISLSIVYSSMVPAAVVIVVKHRACLSVSRQIAGTSAQSFSRQIAGVQARSFGQLQSQRHSHCLFGSQAYRRDSCQIQVAVQCERRVVIAGVLALSVGRCITCILARLLSVQIVVRYQQQGHSGSSIMPATGSYSQAYRHEFLSVCNHITCLYIPTLAVLSLYVKPPIYRLC